MWDVMERTLRVLLVEDAPFLRYAFSRLLRMQGYDVREANDGQEALDCLADYRPHLVLTDLMMPVMGGVELIRRLRADPATAAIPILSVSSDWYLAVEADAALAKPYQRAELLATAERLLREGRGTE